MNVTELMSTAVQCCHPNDSLQRAAQIMWDNDCGCVPIVDDANRVVGIVTDRDACMAVLTQGKLLSDIGVMSAAAKTIVSVNENDSVEHAEALMRDNQVRRLPVLDEAGRLSGLLSLNDIARHAHRTGRRSNGLSGDTIAQTLAAICETREAPPMVRAELRV